MRRRYSDACSFNGVGRWELLWRGAFLYGEGPVLICTWCVETCRDILPERELAHLVCSFCGAERPCVAGPTVAICAACIEMFSMDQPPSWGAVRLALTLPRDALTLLAMIDEHWPSLSANDIPISDAAESPNHAAQLLSLEAGLSDRAEVLPIFTSDELRHRLDAVPPSTEEKSSFVSRMRTRGIKIGF